MERSQNHSVNVADRKVALRVPETCRKRSVVESVLLAQTVGLLQLVDSTTDSVLIVF